MRLNSIFQACLIWPLALLASSASVAVAASHAKKIALATHTAAKAGAEPQTEPGLRLRWALSMDSIGGASASPLASTQAFAPATPWALLLSRASQTAASNRAADAGALAASYQKNQAWASAWMPRVDAAGSITRDRQQVNDNPKVSTPTNTLSLTATLPVWRAADRANAQAQAATADQVRWQAAQTRNSVAREVSQAYLGLVETAEQQRLLKAQAQLLQEQLRINERRLQGGAGTVLDTLETRIRLDQVRAAIQEQRTRSASLRLSLRRLSGQEVLAPAGLAGITASLPNVLPTFDEALMQASQRNPLVQDALAQVRASQATDQARSAERWQPTIDAVAGASRTKQVPKLEGFSQSETTKATSVGLQMNWALFTGGVHNARVKEAAALLTQAQARLDDAQGQLDANLRDAYQTLAQAQALLRVQRQIEQTATATHDALRKAFAAGMRSNLDVLNAQQQIYAARQNMVSATINGLNAQATILALLDQLDADHVVPLAPLFDITPIDTTSVDTSAPDSHP